MEQARKENGGLAALQLESGSEAAAVTRRTFIRKLGTVAVSLSLVDILYGQAFGQEAYNGKKCGNCNPDNNCGKKDADANCRHGKPDDPAYHDKDEGCNYERDGKRDEDGSCHKENQSHEVDEACRKEDKKQGVTYDEDQGCYRSGSDSRTFDSDEACGKGDSDQGCGDCNDNHDDDENCGHQEPGKPIDSDEMCGHESLLFRGDTDEVCTKQKVTDVGCGTHNNPHVGWFPDKDDACDNVPDANCSKNPPDTNCSEGPRFTSHPDESCSIDDKKDQACQAYYDEDENCQKTKTFYDPDDSCGYTDLGYVPPDESCKLGEADHANPPRRKNV